MELSKLWKLIEADLERARATLPANMANAPELQSYREFLNHSELGLACDMLDEYAENHAVDPSFWLAMADAAKKMELLERAAYYRQQSELS